VLALSSSFSISVRRRPFGTADGVFATIIQVWPVAGTKHPMSTTRDSWANGNVISAEHRCQKSRTEEGTAASKYGGRGNMMNDLDVRAQDSGRPLNVGNHFCMPCRVHNVGKVALAQRYRHACSYRCRVWWGRLIAGWSANGGLSSFARSRRMRETRECGGCSAAGTALGPSSIGATRW